MDSTVHDLFRFGVALAIGAMIGVERQFSGTHGDDDEGAGDDASRGAPSEGEMRAAVAAAEQPPDAARSPSTQPTPSSGPPAGTRRGPRPDTTPAGVRTFTLFALTGGITAYLGPTYPWLFPAALLAIAALIVVGYVGNLRARGDTGLTSEISAVTTFLLGAMAVAGHITIAGACAVVVTGLLALKRTLHRFTGHIKQEDILAALKFAVISVVILPLLPSEPIRVGDLLDRRPARSERAEDGTKRGADDATPRRAADDAAPKRDADTPERGAGGEATKRDASERPWWHDVSLSPRKVWYMVVLISGVSFAGYVLVQVLGTSRGLVVTGIAGGLVSSTAVSLSFSQRSRESPELSPRLAMGIVLANSIMPLRLLIVIFLIDVPMALRLAIPLLAMVVAGACVVLWLHLRRRTEGATIEVKLKNPFEITPALKLGAVFALILVVAQVVQELFSTAVLYVLGFLSGLTDVDAIGLAMANESAVGRMQPVTAAVVVALAVIGNTLFKAGFVLYFGAPHLRRIGLVAFTVLAASAGAGVVGARALFGG